MIYTDNIHLMGETVDEVHAFAKDIGLHRCWFENHPRHPHYDLINKKRTPLKDKEGVLFRDKAIAFGAMLVSPKQLIRIAKLCYQMPTTEEEVVAFEQKYKWNLSQPLTKEDEEILDRMQKRLMDKLFGGKNEQ